ncbi:MAG: hypothetical protein DRP76_03940, partial [Candidatus Omnitrophota bacterium]
ARYIQGIERIIQELKKVKSKPEIEKLRREYAQEQRNYFIPEGKDLRDYPEIYLPEVAEKEKEINEAFKDAERRVELSSKENYISEAKRYLKEEKYDKAIEIAKEVLKIDSKSLEAHRILFEAYYGKGDFNMAIAIYGEFENLSSEERLQQLEEKTEMMFKAGIASWRTGEKEKAIEMVKKAIEINPELKKELNNFPELKEEIVQSEGRGGNREKNTSSPLRLSLNNKFSDDEGVNNLFPTIQELSEDKFPRRLPLPSQSPLFKLEGAEINPIINIAMINAPILILKEILNLAKNSVAKAAATITGNVLRINLVINHLFPSIDSKTIARKDASVKETTFGEEKGGNAGRDGENDKKAGSSLNRANAFPFAAVFFSITAFVKLLLNLIKSAIRIFANILNLKQNFADKGRKKEDNDYKITQVGLSCIPQYGKRPPPPSSCKDLFRVSSKKKEEVLKKEVERCWRRLKDYKLEKLPLLLKDMWLWLSLYAGKTTVSLSKIKRHLSTTKESGTCFLKRLEKSLLTNLLISIWVWLVLSKKELLHRLLSFIRSPPAGCLKPVKISFLVVLSLVVTFILSLSSPNIIKADPNPTHYPYYLNQYQERKLILSLPLDSLIEKVFNNLPLIKLGGRQYHLGFYQVNLPLIGRRQYFVLAEGIRFRVFEREEPIALSRENLSKVYIPVVRDNKLRFVPFVDYQKVKEKYLQRVSLPQLLENPYTIKVKDTEIALFYKEGRIRVSAEKEKKRQEFLLKEGEIVEGEEFIILFFISPDNLGWVEVLNKDYLNYPFREEKVAQISLSQLAKESCPFVIVHKDLKVGVIPLPLPTLDFLSSFALVVQEKEKSSLIPFFEFLTPVQIDKYSIRIELTPQGGRLIIEEVKDGREAKNPYSLVSFTSSPIDDSEGKVISINCPVLKERWEEKVNKQLGSSSISLPRIRKEGIKDQDLIKSLEGYEDREKRIVEEVNEFIEKYGLGREIQKIRNKNIEELSGYIGAKISGRVVIDEGKLSRPLSELLDDLRRLSCELRELSYEDKLRILFHFLNNSGMAILNAQLLRKEKVIEAIRDLMMAVE